MALENFTTYTEVDTNSHISKTSTRVTWSNLNRNEDAYLYKDFGIGYFEGDFTVNLTLNITSPDESGTYEHILTLANSLDDFKGIDDASGDALTIQHLSQSGTTTRIAVQELDGGTLYTSSYYNITANTAYYLKIIRDESVGTYGTLYCYIYSDAARTTLLSTLSVTLHTSKKDFRYIYPIQTYNDSNNFPMGGYVENLNLFDADAGYAATYPINELLRASGIRRTFWAGLGGQSVYQCELALGGMTTSYVSPIGSRDIPSAVTPSAVIDPLRAYINRPPPITETGLPGVTMPFTSTAPTAPQMAERAGMGSVEYDKIIQQGKTTEALREFGPITGPADLERFRTQYPQLGI